MPFGLEDCRNPCISSIERGGAAMRAADNELFPT
jgi:hypothetical protein